jgi:aclacinomycin oxidase
MEIHRLQFGKIIVRGLSTVGAGSDRQIDEHLASLGAGAVQPRLRWRSQLSWIGFALDPFPELFAMPPGGVSVKVKDALLKRRLSDEQLAIAFEHLVSTESNVFGGVLGMVTYGGRVNSVPAGATASAARDAIIDMACNVGWLDPREADENLRWVRAIYREIFAETGGVPVPGDAYAGALINHPDVDLADETFNTSGVAWPTLYYRENYPRLQRVKATWDPLDVFRHRLAIRAG